MNKRLLNVDDNEPARYAKSRVLGQAGFAVVDATNGREALKLTEEQQPAVVLLDVKLPDMSGLEVCRIIKQNWPQIMVLQTSASFTTGADRTRGLDSGADAYLVQPVEPEELVASVQALLRIRRAENELRTLNENLERRVEDRTRDLAAAYDELKHEIARREKIEGQLVQSQKMEAIGHLTGGIAHDFNNLLTAIIGNVDLIRARTADQRIARLAENALRAAQRGSKLAAQLLTFSRTQKLDTRPTDINALVCGMTELLGQSLGPQVAIHMALGRDVGPAFADGNQLELAILNLAINARDAMPSGGALTISTAEREIKAGDPSLAPGLYVTVAVADTGAGMPPEVAAQAFDPFFTTKPPGKGTGLGLSQVYGIAKQSGGEARIASTPGQGTVVTLWLRRAERAAMQEADRSRGELGAKQRGRILLVDDDPDVVKLVLEFLPELGYDVRVADHGEAGLSLLEESGADLVVVDFAMPGMNGAELATAIRLRWPDLPLIFMSGYADSNALQASLGEAPFLHKPFLPADLAAAVRDALFAR